MDREIRCSFANHTPIAQQDWYKLIRHLEVEAEQRCMFDACLIADSIICRVLENHSALLLWEQAALVGVEEQLQWIQMELSTRNIKWHYGFTEELIDVSDEVEDVIDLLILRSATQWFILFICDFIGQCQLHQKL